MIDIWKTVVMQRFAKFDGRAGRSEFWWYYLANIVINLVLTILMVIGFNLAGALGVLVLLVLIAFWVVIIVPTVALAIRRLHDTDKSGWWLLIGFVPIVGTIVLLVFYIMEGTSGPNNFGAAAEPASA